LCLLGFPALLKNRCDDFGGFPKLTSDLPAGRQKVSYEWTQGLGPETEILSSNKGVDRIVDRNTEPVGIPADLVAQKYS
jgi:hypothetical protein